MRQWFFLTLASGLSLCCLAAGRTNAQGIATLADDIVLLSKGVSAKEKALTHQHLAAPGYGVESRLPPSPGAGGPLLGEPRGAGTPTDILGGVSQPEGGRLRAAPQIAPPAQLPSRPAPLAGPLALPTTDEEGPPDGLTLDAAIDMLVERNYDLLTRYQELPKADADILSAGLRLNPLVTGGVDGVPYGRYSEQRPGEIVYSSTVIQPWDINQKRRDRVVVARRAKRVLEAQYQNAVRLEIDNLYTAYVDVLDAREVVRYTQASLKLFDEAVETTRALVQKGVQPQTELDRAIIQRNNAAMALRAAEVALRHAKRVVGTLLNLPPDQAECFEVRGKLGEAGIPVPCLDQLVQLALEARPDLNSFRLGVDRARADVQLARAERVPDLFVLYTPYTYTDNSQAGAGNTKSWGVGLLTTLPAFNRNQGNIRRAQINVAQVQIELSGLERQVISEVQRAALDYTATQDAVRQFEQGILDRAKNLRDAEYRSFTRGQVGYGTYLQAQREYSDTLRLYLDARIRHRRAMLRLNTAVGQRVAP